MDTKWKIAIVVIAFMAVAPGVAKAIIAELGTIVPIAALIGVGLWAGLKISQTRNTGSS